MTNDEIDQPEARARETSPRARASGWCQRSFVIRHSSFVIPGRESSVKKLFKRLPLLLSGVGLVAALVYGFRPAPVPVDLAPVTRGLLQVSVEKDGKTRIKQRYIVAAPIAGRMQRIDFKPGDTVYS